ncbi:MAG: indolepyruvate oxidoreductase subunit beta [Ruminococcaceae bacterium]|nr:indolepyruvate oxidoreductase subunit beta [Oscillospiraceae bacterium]
MPNILIVGVGGQGSLLASRMIGAFYQNQGLTVKVSEVHGMSQRGGSVVTYVRAGEDVASPIIPVGEADVILSFEELEALRWAHYAKDGGAIVYSTQNISPMPVITGAAEYPSEIGEKLKKYNVRQQAIDALSLSLEAGNVKAANVVLIGAASKLLGGTSEEWNRVLEEVVPPKFLDLNRRAFALGADAE